MTVEAARTHLETARPEYIDSNYDFSNKFRISEKTGTMLLRTARYKFIPEENRWKRMPSPTDILAARIKRVEEKLDIILGILGYVQSPSTPTSSAAPSLSEAIRQQKAKELLNG